MVASSDTAAIPMIPNKTQYLFGEKALIPQFTNRITQHFNLKKTMKTNSKRKKFLHIFVYSLMVYGARAQEDYEGSDSHKEAAAPPPAENSCNGIFLSYTFVEREKEFPHIKNASAQPWAFKSTATILNAGMFELKNWKIFIGFQHKELLVAASNAVLVDQEEFPAHVGNGTSLVGYPQTDLKTSIDTAGDLTQIQAIVELSGTQFGIKPPGYPMPKVIKLVNNGYRCPKPKRKGRTMHVCCVKDPKSKLRNTTTTKHYPRQKGDLEISYDVLQTYANNYQAQVLIENMHPLGRLDNWNLTWEWMRGEFIYSMRGAYTHRRDYSKCIYGPAGQYYTDMDFSKVMNCEKSPVIADLPPDREKDKEIGNIPFCCRNGTLLPTIMNETKSVAVFQLQVFKLPPDLNRTALYPPGKWRIEGDINPQYKCGPALRVDETEFPDFNGLQVTSTAIASWQVVCNITKPKIRENKCCVSYSAYYNDSVIPCNTCACGCGDPEKSEKCNQNARPLFLPSEALLVPFENRTLKAVAWAKLMHFPVPKTLPCGDNCGVSINWHIATNYRTGWTARITIFNWKEIAIPDWFVAIQFNKSGSRLLRAYSFNGTLLPDLNDTIFLQGLPYMNYLIAETNGTKPDEDPRVPGKQQSVLQFKKKKMGQVHIQKGDGFPTKLLFNGEECALPTRIPQPNGSKSNGKVGVALIIALLTLLLRIPD